MKQHRYAKRSVGAVMTGDVPVVSASFTISETADYIASSIRTFVNVRSSVSNIRSFGTFVGFVIIAATLALAYAIFRSY